MLTLLRALALALLGGGALAHSARAAAELPLALRGVNPDKLSGGLFLALDSTGAFGGARPVPRARAGFADLSKGRPPAVLDARVGVNVRVGDDPDDLLPTQRGQAEPHVYRSVANANLLLASFQEGRFAENGGALDCGYGVSRDGGLTWSRALTPGLTVASGGPYLRATDPVAAIGPQGDFYLNALGSIDNAFGLSAIVVSRSTDTGATWSAPTVVFQSPNSQTAPDKNWMVVNDFAAAPNSGRLVVTWTNFTSNAVGASTGNHLAAAVSDDRGATWSTPTLITPVGSNNQGTLPVFLPDGSLAVIYITFLGTTTQFNIQCKRSLDGGRTYPATATTVVGLVNGWDDPEMRDGVFLPAATVARGTGDILVTYTALVSGTPRVLVVKSSDQGTTWSTPTIASDNPAGGSVMNPAIAASPDGRTVSLVFMDKRLAPDGRGFVDHFAALSFDGGTTWQPNLRLSELSSDIRYGPQTSRGVMLGDYLGLAPAPNTSQPCVAVWCDTRTGDSDPYTVRFTPADLPGFGNWAVARAVSGSFLDDDDVDGDPNYLEFVNGTNPKFAESGNDLVLRVSAPTTLDLIWTERANVQRSPFTDGASSAPYATFLAGGFSGSATVAASLAPDQLPTVPLRSGLVWRGARSIVATGTAQIAARSVRISAGLPPRASAVVTAILTDARLINLSTRGQVKPGVGQLIVGFVIDGNKSVLVRAAGPALRALGVNNALADPRLSLSSPGSSVAFTNDNWQQGNADAALFARLGAFPFAAGGLDAALFQSLAAQNYTAIVASASDSQGVALVEAYDADAVPGAPGNPRLLNLSTRADVGAGENALIAGFVLTGTQPRRVLIRAIGPSLAAFGVTGALADPVLTLYRGATVLATNDDWEISRSGAAIAVTAQRVGAFALEAASLDAALLTTLPPGPYTVVVTGVDDATGIALVEVYDAD